MELKIILEIFLVFVLPVLLWHWKIIPVEHNRLHALYGMNALALVFVLLRGFSLTELGIRTDNIINALPIYALGTIFGIIIIFIGAKILKITKNNGHTASIKSIWHYLQIGVLQETLYRGYLIPLLVLFFSPWWTIILNSTLFTLVHLIHKNKKTTIPLVFVGGLAFAGVYYLYPNLILISLVHFILVYYASSLGFFELPNTKSNT